MFAVYFNRHIATHLFPYVLGLLQLVFFQRLFTSTQKYLCPACELREYNL